MCAGCWQEYGAPQIDNPKVRETAAAVDKVYEYSCVGGNLHVVVDDFNIEDGSLDFCEQEAIPQNIHEANERELAAERHCLTLLRSLSIEERASALALSQTYQLWQPAQVTA